MVILESIIHDLRSLPASRLLDVANYINQLNPKRKTQEERLAGLMATAGCMKDEEGEDFERAVKEASEHIDEDTSKLAW